MGRTAAWLLILLTAAAPAGRRALGRYDGWTVLADAHPRRCFAIAEPLERAGGDRLPALAVTAWPGRAPGGQLHVRLSHGRREGTPVRLTVAGRSFALLAHGGDAWAADARDDARIVAAARGGDRLEVTATGTRGGRFTDPYALTGFSSAVDQAILACAG